MTSKSFEIDICDDDDNGLVSQTNTEPRIQNVSNVSEAKNPKLSSTDTPNNEPYYTKRTVNGSMEELDIDLEEEPHFKSRTGNTHHQEPPVGIHSSNSGAASPRKGRLAKPLPHSNLQHTPASLEGDSNFLLDLPHKNDDISGITIENC